MPIEWFIRLECLAFACGAKASRQSMKARVRRLKTGRLADSRASHSPQPPTWDADYPNSPFLQTSRLTRSSTYRESVSFASRAALFAACFNLGSIRKVKRCLRTFSTVRNLYGGTRWKATG